MSTAYGVLHWPCRCGLKTLRRTLCALTLSTYNGSVLHWLCRCGLETLRRTLCALTLSTYNGSFVHWLCRCGLDTLRRTVCTQSECTQSASAPQDHIYTASAEHDVRYSFNVVLLTMGIMMPETCRKSEHQSVPTQMHLVCVFFSFTI
jgi:hypothetical protein